MLTHSQFYQRLGKSLRLFVVCLSVLAFGWSGHSSPRLEASQATRSAKVSLAPAAILTVGANCTYPTLQEAIDNANPDDEIHVAGETWIGDEANITIDKNLTIIGGYNDDCSDLTLDTRTVLDGTGETASSVAQIDTPGITVELHNIDITGGEDDGDGGGGIDVNGSESNSVILYNTDIYANESHQGGGIDISRGELYLDHSRVHQNNALENGGGISCDNGATISITDSYQALIIGGLHSVSNNVADSDQDEIGNGGGLYLDDCELRLEGDDGLTSVANNEAYNGGGIYALNGSHIVIPPHTTHGIASVLDNTARNNGGGIYLFGASLLEMEAGQVNGNTAAGQGGGLYVTGLNTQANLFGDQPCTAEKCLAVSDNLAISGGGIYITGRATLHVFNTYMEENVVENPANIAAARGSALYINSGSTEAIVEGAVIADNRSDGNHTIVVDNSALLNISYSTIAYNQLTNNPLVTETTVFGNLSTSGASVSSITLLGKGLIVWGNNGTGTIRQDAEVSLFSTSISDSLLEFEGDVEGSDNLVADPQFIIDGPAGDYHIRRESPAIDHAGPDIGAPSIDIDREVRPNPYHNEPNSYDAGADEFRRLVGLNGEICQYGSIGEAVLAAENGDTLHISNGVYYEEAPIFIDKELTLRSASSDCTVANSNPNEADVLVDGSLITVPASNGGLINIGEGHIVVFRGMTLQNSEATQDGGLVYVAPDASVNFANVRLTQGQAGNNGGLLYLDTGATAEAMLTFMNDGIATNQGGLIYLAENATFSMGIASVFFDGVANEGGGVYINGGLYEMYFDSRVTVSQANIRGGGVVIMNGGQLIMHDTSRIGAAGVPNEALQGAGVFMHGNDTLLELHDDSRITHNNATGDGGGILAVMGPTIVMYDNSYIEDNTADDGGGLFIETPNTSLTMYDHSRINDNQADHRGGGFLPVRAQPLPFLERPKSGMKVKATKPTMVGAFISTKHQ